MSLCGLNKLTYICEIWFSLRLFTCLNSDDIIKSSHTFYQSLQVYIWLRRNQWCVYSDRDQIIAWRDSLGEDRPRFQRYTILLLLLNEGYAELFWSFTYRYDASMFSNTVLLVTKSYDLIFIQMQYLYLFSHDSTKRLKYRLQNMLPFYSFD